MFIIDINKSSPLKRNCHNGNIDSLEVIYMKYLPRVKDGQGYFFIFSWILRRLGIQLRGKQLWCISHSNCLVNIRNSFIFLSDLCNPKDDDHCLQTSPGWGASYECFSSTEYCSSYGKDMMRCCPETCNTGAFTREDCNGYDGFGKCIYIG